MPAVLTRRDLMAAGARLAAGAALAAPAVVVAARTQMHATARVIPTSPQRYELRPGPTLALRLVRAARFRRRALTARIAPARDAQEAARIATALSAR